MAPDLDLRMRAWSFRPATLSGIENGIGVGTPVIARQLATISQSVEAFSGSPSELAAGGEEFPCVGTNLASEDRASF